MKRNLVLVGLLVVIAGGAAIPAKADTPDALRDAATSALQKLDQFVARESAKLGKDARETREVGVQLNSVADQSALLNDRLKNRQGELEQKIGELDEQIQKLKAQAGKLTNVLERMTELLPVFMDAVGSDQGGAASQRVLAAISQDQAKAAKLLDAIKSRSADQVGSLLRRNTEGVRLQVGEMPAGEEPTVNFRIGNLVHCLSTGKRCRGAASSLAKTPSRDAPDPDQLLQQLHSLATAANRDAAACNKRIEELLATATAAAGGLPSTNADRTADLRRLIERLVELQSTATQLSRDIAAAMDRVIRRT